MVTGILPRAVELGLFNTDYRVTNHDEFVGQLQAQGASADIIAKQQDARDKHLCALREFIEQQFDARPKDYEVAKIDFERLFALVEAELLGFHAQLRFEKRREGEITPSDALELQLKLVLCGTLIASTRDSQCEFHDAIARWLDSGDVVVSFNYDLLMDRSLRHSGRWHADDGYAIKFHEHIERQGDEVKWLTSRKTQSDVKLLKPHGSLNWLYPRNSWDSVLNMSLHPEFEYPKPPERLYCLKDMHGEFEQDYPSYEWWERYDFEYNGTTYDLHSLLIPPSLTKPYRVFEGILGPTWGAFCKYALERVEEIVLIGYSLRADDMRTHWLLRKVARENTSLKRVLVVDPSDEVFQRARRLFSPLQVQRVCNTIGELAELIARRAV